MGGLRLLRLRGGDDAGQQGQEQERGDDERELARTHRCDLSWQAKSMDAPGRQEEPVLRMGNTPR